MAQELAASAYFAPTQADTTHAASPNLTRNASVEEVPEPRAGATGKRGRDGGDQISEATRPVKKSRVSEDELRLMGNYTAPRDAQPIFPSDPYTAPKPEYDAERDWRGKSNTEAEKPTVRRTSYTPRSTHKPTNTLNNFSRQSAKHNQRSPSSEHAGDMHSRPTGLTSPRGRQYPRPDSLATNASRGSNVTDRHKFVDRQNMFEQGAARAAKRQKPNAAGRPHIDLTQDAQVGILEGRAVASQGRRPRQSSIDKADAQQRHEDAFGSKELHSVDNRVSGRKLGRPRSAESIPSTRSHRSGSHAAKGSRSPRRAPEAQTIHILDDDDGLAEAPEKSRRIPHIPVLEDQSSQRPSIRLADGLDKAGQQHKERMASKLNQPGGMVDVSQTNGLLQNSNSRGVNQPAQRRQQHISQSKILARPGIDYSMPEAGVSLSIDLNNTSLRKTFRRDESASKSNSRLGVDEQIASNRISHETDEEVDELAGGNTIESPRSRNTSPEKALNSTCLPTSLVNSNKRTRPKSPSDLEPTEFEHKETLDVKRSKRFPKSKAIEDHAVRLTVRELVCKAGVLQDGGELVWDAHTSAFLIFQSGQAVPSGNSDRALTIGPKEVNREWAQDPSSLRVRMKGSQTDTSSGLMHVEFSNTKGRATCFELLQESSGGNLKICPATSVEMDKTFKKQMQEVQQFQSKTPQLARRNPTGSTPRSLSRVGRAVATSADDSIVYESEEDIRPMRARERMQGGQDDTISAALEGQGFQRPRPSREGDGNLSKYFPQQPRRTTRQSRPTETKAQSPPPPMKWTQENNPSRWPYPVVYPADGVRKTTVDFEDLERLDEGEWLNDNLVAFVLRHIEENMEPQHKEKVHFFNTFFYTSLSMKGSKKAFNYNAVKRWTKNVDIFTKSYLVVPVNHDLHWFVAIICNLPNILRKCDAFSDDEEDAGVASADAPVQVAEAIASSEAEDNQETVTEDLRSDDATKVLNGLSLLDQGSVTPPEGVFNFGSDGKVTSAQSTAQSRQATPEDGQKSISTQLQIQKKSKKKGVALRKYDTDEPVIVALDSFGVGRSTELKYLKLYVQAEAKEKRGIDLDAQDLKGMSAKGIPEQPNYSDCGVYLSGYIEQFAKDPDTFVRKVLQREMDENNDFVSFDPSKKRDAIRDTLLGLQKKQNEARIAAKRAKIQSKKVVAPSSSQHQAVVAAPTTASAAPIPSQLSSGSALHQEEPELNAQLDRQTTPLQEIADYQDSSRTMTEGKGDELRVSPPRAFGQAAQKDDSGQSSPSQVYEDEPGDKALEGMGERAGTAPSKAISEHEQDQASVDGRAKSGMKSPSKLVSHSVEQRYMQPGNDANVELSDSQSEKAGPPAKNGGRSPQVIIGTGERLVLEVPDSQEQGSQSVVELC